ncbi:LysR family transcriptional regulator [Rhizobacter sp. Root1221]|uniref:LysR family transcriptional regulator n=1 Tax=Rhizobacter sp. Root1221 TaxID=1736433 RepID=UPI0006F98326|nr:LysR family transcriptional regulator [Rhizobacter sp. Root1221]KQV99244.1 LysR family transcriptional regulator [Rhizobacter sp. Root1221]
MRTFDLDSLEIFRTVVREGGVVRAAARLHRVQSNVTTRIKQLEQRLGVALFRRQGRTLALTPAGDALLVHAERLLRLADEAESALRADPARGPFRLGSMESTAGSRLPKLLSRYHRLHPGVVIELQTGTTGALLRKLADYQLDAAFVGEPFSAPDLNSQPVFEEELVLITGKQNPPVQQAGELLTGTILAFPGGCSYRRKLEDWFATGEVMPRRVMEFASYQAIIACVAAGTGCAIVPVSVLHALRATSEVRQHALPEPIGTSRTHLAWNGTPSPALERLLALLAALQEKRPAFAGPEAVTA